MISNIVNNLAKENPSAHSKRSTPSKDKLCGSLYEKNIDDFISFKSKALFNRLKIDESFLNERPTSWSSNASFQYAKNKVLTLRAVNDAAERAVKLIQDFHRKIIVEDEQKEFLLRCVQEHRYVYPDYPFAISDARFIEIFRLSKYLCKLFLAEITPYMVPRRRSDGISRDIRVLVALRFFAQGCYQRCVGQSSLLNVSQAVVSRCVKQVANIMNRYFVVKYIKWPRTIQKLCAIKEKFYEKFRFPGVIGAIDCTHIKIKTPNLAIEHVYDCRKGGHSLNVQVVCDYNLKILDCNARFGGTAHDASIWRASALRVLLTRKYENGDRNFRLIGDSGYPLLPFLMTPVQGNNLSTAHNNYNVQHRKARNWIERCFGLLKSRIRCFSSERTLMYDPETEGKIVNSCLVLHNFIITHNIMNEVNDVDCAENTDEEINEDNDFEAQEPVPEAFLSHKRAQKVFTP
ncbi:putative nuclease HARBI1 [Teleopsis dalmanni]|uniref:putative nuclease HARBI1 n=1 Tax=Teleopsis dalmanni TaxID=139649 RepID=UPI0018CEF78B|nr:putative nuclease HARBI1 [Teleopsis dalmanni]